MPCFIRRNDRKGWVEGRAHHHRALTQFFSEGSSSRVSVPHGDGGDFVADFGVTSRDDNYTLCHYVDEKGEKVEIMDCLPEYADYINRLIDH